MSKLPKSLFIGGAILLVISLTPAGANFYHGTIRPFAATLLAMGMITHLLHKETVRYDEDHAHKPDESGQGKKA